MDVLTDNARAADEDNPKGYFELEAVKQLDKGGDKEWLQDARGRAIKVISALLADLPAEHRYNVVFMRRELDEVVASQNKMLERRGEPIEEDAATVEERFAAHLRKIGALLRTDARFESIEVDYRDAMTDPERVARMVAKFVGGRLNVGAMAAAVDLRLYRNRGG
jgi:hypothetical protein